METTLNPNKLLWRGSPMVKLQNTLIRGNPVPFAMDKQLVESPQSLQVDDKPKLAPKLQALLPVDVQPISTQPHPQGADHSLDLPRSWRWTVARIFKNAAAYLR
jgi:hypothetical protein